EKPITNVFDQNPQNIPVEIQESKPEEIPVKAGFLEILDSVSEDVEINFSDSEANSDSIDEENYPKENWTARIPQLLCDNVTDIEIPEHLRDRFVYFYFYPELKLLCDTKTGMFRIQNIVDQLLENERKTGYKVRKQKEANEWLRNKNVKEMIQEFANYLHQPIEYLVVNRKDLPNGLRGYWVHEVLVDHVGIWASPRFAWKVSLILKQCRDAEQFALLQEKRSLEERQSYDAEKLKELMATNTDLLHQVFDLNKRIDTLHSGMLREKTELEEMKKSNQEMQERVNELKNQTKEQQAEMKLSQVRTEETLSSLYVLTWEENGHSVYYLTIRRNYLPKDTPTAQVYFQALYPAPMEIKKEMHTLVDGNRMPLLQNYAYITNINAVIDVLMEYYKPVRIVINHHRE
ncbi:KilA-N domain-containing protein, partial [Methanobrevibacter sp.]